jgi:hypothetical protein
VNPTATAGGDAAGGGGGMCTAVPAAPWQAIRSTKARIG